MKIKEEEHKNNWLKLYTPEEIRKSLRSESFCFAYGVDIVAQSVTRVITEMIPKRRLITRNEFTNVPNLYKELQQSSVSYLIYLNSMAELEVEEGPISHH